MMKSITCLLAVVLLATGLIGLFEPSFMGMALNLSHSLLLLAAGSLTLYFGVQGTEFQARDTCKALGILFGLIGLATFFAGPGVATAGGLEIRADDVLKLLPGQIELTTSDAIRNLIIGVLAIMAGFFPREQEIQIDMKVQDMQIKAAKQTH
ncbi:MAG: hypothetical protein SFY67_00335 [Candidatus Melainabacteria bacterium]|nr:hypothetical protein [Candidatus Melainabacteria bacterium]